MTRAGVTARTHNNRIELTALRAAESAARDADCVILCIPVGAVGETTKAIAGALKQPGHAIVLVQLRPLLAQNGVLDRLHAQGFTVKTPGED